MSSIDGTPPSPMTLARATDVSDALYEVRTLIGQREGMWVMTPRASERDKTLEVTLG